MYMLVGTYIPYLVGISKVPLSVEVRACSTYMYIHPITWVFPILYMSLSMYVTHSLCYVTLYVTLTLTPILQLLRFYAFHAFTLLRFYAFTLSHLLPSINQLDPFFLFLSAPNPSFT